MCCLAIVSGFPVSSLAFCLLFWPDSPLKLFFVVLFLVLQYFSSGKRNHFASCLVC